MVYQTVVKLSIMLVALKLARGDQHLRVFVHVPPVGHPWDPDNSPPPDWPVWQLANVCKKAYQCDEALIWIKMEDC